ncbi:MAG: hypothetical protein ACOYMV_14090 [Verrucomicrobiia bacterium]
MFVRHFVGVSLNRQIIREWQLEQTGRHEFIFRFVSTQKEGLENNLARIRESFLLTLGISASIEMRHVPEIPPSASGKQRWIINRLSSSNADGSRGDYRRKPACSG